MSQEQGFIGRLVAGMIQRSVRRRFHTVYWRSHSELPKPPLILYANHHGWMDGYLLFHLVKRLGIECVDWIQEFEAFPLFSLVGGLRFPKGDVHGRAETIRKTIRLLKEGKSLVIFPEGVLHRPPDVWSFGRGLQLIVDRVPGVSMAPVAIHYELSMHERPEAWIEVGEPHRFDSLRSCELRLGEQLALLRKSILNGDQFEVLATGSPDVNEKWRFPTR